MKGDVRAQYQLYSLYSKAMYNICYRMTNMQEEAEDMLQESFSYAFILPEVAQKHYPKNDFHKFYMGEIVNVLSR
jgi:DNA-directed RNA polymerase specialized sigma24 family protein